MHQPNKVISIEKDLPILDSSEDLLNRDHFAKQLATAINDYAQIPKNTDGLVIGLEGPWGSGKTSLFNLTKKYLSEDFIIKVFNPWLTLNRTNLVTEFFRIISEFSTKNSSLAKLVLEYGMSIIQSLVHSNISPIPISIFGITLNFSIEKSMEKFFKQPSLSDKKENIISTIKSKKDQSWLIIFIDDLDRLSYDEIGIVFQLVKNIADFPKVIYVLAYDHEIVAKALDKVQEDKGNEYIQKIVQVVYDVPMPGEGEIFNYFGKKLEVILDRTNLDFFDNEHLATLMDHGCIDYLQNIRDCNRVLNAFQLKYSLCGQECDIGDLLAITIFELFEPMVYATLPGYKNVLLGRGMYGIVPIKKEELRDNFSLLLNQKNIRRKDCCKAILSAMFPAVDRALNIQVNNVDSNNSLNNKICNSDCFDRYFCLRIKSTDIPIENLLSFFKLTDENKIFEQLKSWSINSQARYAFKNLMSLLNNPNSSHVSISNEIVPLYLHALSKIYFSEASDFIHFSPAQLEMQFIGVLLGFTNHEQGNQGVDIHFLESLFQDKKIAVYILEYILNWCSAGHVWKFSNNSLQEATPIISGDEFDRLKQFYLDRVKLSIGDRSLFEEEYYRGTLLIWKYLDLESYQNYIKHSHSVKEKFYLLNSFVSYSIINGNMKKRVYRINRDLSSDYDPDIVYEWAKECIKSGDFRSYPTRKSDLVIAYSIIYNKSKNDNADFLKIQILQSDVEKGLEKVFKQKFIEEGIS